MKEFVYHRLLLPSVARNADRPVATNAATGVSTTYAEHLDRVSRLIGGMRALGLERSDRFAVLALNSPEYLELYHAGFLGGGVVNPLNLRFAPRELIHVLRDSGTSTCFVDATFAPVIDAIREQAELERIVLIGEADVPHTTTYDELLATGRPVIPDEGEESDPAVLMYTGGTTGMPKGVLHDQRGQIMNAYHVMMKINRGRDSVNLLQTPMFHAASIVAVVAGPATGGRLVILPMFEPVAVMDALETYRPTTTTMVPTMIGLVMAHPDFRPECLSGLTDLVYGASPMPEPLLERLLAEYPHVNIWQGYGMTEAGSVVTMLGPEEHRMGDTYLRSAGSPCSASSSRSRTPSGGSCPPEETGEVCARGANVMVGYWRQPEATATALRDGWLAHGGRRLRRQGRLPLPDGPGEGHDRDRRGERLLQRGGERAGQPPGGPTGGGHRHPPRAVGRSRARRRGAPRRLRGHRAGTDSPCPRVDRRLQSAEDASSSGTSPCRCPER